MLMGKATKSESKSHESHAYGIQGARQGKADYALAALEAMRHRSSLTVDVRTCEEPRGHMIKQDKKGERAREKQSQRRMVRVYVTIDALDPIHQVLYACVCNCPSKPFPLCFPINHISGRIISPL